MSLFRKGELISLVIFRADASECIGGGHVMRCLTLAEALARSGWHCAFVCAANTLAAVPLLVESRYDTVGLDGNVDDEPDAVVRRWPQGCDLLVVDHYRRDSGFESACRGWAKRILVIDDLANRPHECDFLLDQTLGRRESDYRALLPATSALFLGPAFALLRPQFPATRDQALARRQRHRSLRRILVSLGASDPHNLTRMVLDGIGESGVAAEVDVVLGAGAENLRDVQAAAERIPQTVSLHVDVRDMAALMAVADLAIGAAGISSWERCCLGLPSLLVVTADNQARIATALSAAGAAISLGWRADVTATAIARQLRRLASNKDERRRMSEAAAAICDGGGADRVVARLAA